jgi:prepilin-type N-terminal cleavage/methylation domain-containing protein
MQRLVKILKGQKGFTLIELVLVIIILALLVGLAALNMVGTSDDAKIARVKADNDTIATAIKVYRIKIGSYPTMAQLVPTYLDETPVDPNSSAYTLTTTATNVTIVNTYSTGLNKVITRI